MKEVAGVLREIFGNSKIRAAKISKEKLLLGGLSINIMKFAPPVLNN